MDILQGQAWVSWEKRMRALYDDRGSRKAGAERVQGSVGVPGGPSREERAGDELPLSDGGVGVSVPVARDRRPHMTCATVVPRKKEHPANSRRRRVNAFLRE